MALLVKTDEAKGRNTIIIQNHVPLSYGIIVKASNYIPIELIKQYNIPTTPIVYRGSESRKNVARRFVKEIVDISRQVEKLLETNIPINMSENDTRRNNANNICNLCKQSFTTVGKVRDHCHLTGKFRQSLCFKCNLDLKQPKFVPCFLHN